jgi:PAS domain S-box-containing protein
MNYDGLEGLAQALFEESGDALFLVDPETDQLLDANSTAQRLTGLPLRELLRLPLDRLLRFGGPGGLKQLRSAAGESGAFHAQDGYSLCTAQPDVYTPVNVTVSRLHVRPQTLALITARDAREQFAAQSRLQQAEQELRRLLAAVPDCLWGAEIDAAGRWSYRYVSPAAEQITGQPAAVFLGGVHRWWSVVHPEDQPRWEKALARLRAGQPTQEEYRVARPDGSCRWVRETVRVGAGGGGRALRLYGVVSDITPYRQAEARACPGDERLRGLLDGGPVPAFLKDADGRFVYANRPFAALCGKAPAEVVGRTDGDLFPAEVVRALRQGDAAILAGEKPPEALASVAAPDGVLRRWLVFKYPVTGANGQRLLGGMAVDVTDRGRPT